MSKFVKIKSGFPIRYKQFIRHSVAYRTKKTIQDRKNQKAFNENLNDHLLTYQNVNQTIIGSFLFKLLHDSLNNPEVYQNERLIVLKEMYIYVEQNKAWYDLWKTLKLVEEHVIQKKGVIAHQVAIELEDMMRLNISYPKILMGLNHDGTPILGVPPFYLTEKTLNYIENRQSAGRKKGREQYNINTQTSEFFSYLTHSFGLYQGSHMDLLAQNGVSNETVPTIKFPRKLAETDKLIDFIEKNRHFTMNPNGVVIDCYNCGDIDQVILFEQEGYVLWKVIFEQKGIKMHQKGDLVEDGSGAEYCGYFSPSFYPRSTFSEHITFIDFEYGVYDFVLECYADVVCGASLINKKFQRDVVNMGTMHMQEEEQDDGKMGLRFVPRKIHNQAKEKVKTKVDYEKEIKKYFIAGHVRRLPENQSPSKEAIAHAHEFGIELPKNYTFVRPYETGEEKVRSYYTKKL